MKNSLGYLINAQQIIAYAKWYLNNPLRQFAPTYHDNHDLQDTDETDPKMLSEVYSKSYATRDITKVRTLIKDAERHPDKVAFGEVMYKSLWQAMDGFDTFGFNTGYRKSFHDESAPLTIPQYMNFLKKQTVLSFKDVVTFVKKANAINERRNARRKAWNEHCDAIITKLAKKSSKRVQYKKFLSPTHRLEDEAIDHECPNDMAFDLDSVYGIDDKMLNDVLAMSSKKSIAYRDFCKFTVDKSGQVYYKGKATNVYGNIAYWSARKTDLVPLIDVNKLPKTPVFKKDISFNVLLQVSGVEGGQGYRIVDGHPNTKGISNQHEIKDYENFVADRQTVKD